jgi:hypothetical protein
MTEEHLEGSGKPEQRPGRHPVIGATGLRPPVPATVSEASARKAVFQGRRPDHPVEGTPLADERFPA